MSIESQHEKSDVPESLTALPIDRVAGMMRGWWAERSMARIAQDYGITRQRVGQVLSWCGCTSELLCKAKHDRPDSHRRASQQRVAEARRLLRHRLASKLTVRQRCALLWLAQELILTDIARRMATTAQGVNALLVGARWRLERLDLKSIRNARQSKGSQDFKCEQDHGEMPITEFDVILLDSIELTEALAPQKDSLQLAPLDLPRAVRL